MKYNNRSIKALSISLSRKLFRRIFLTRCIFEKVRFEVTLRKFLHAQNYWDIRSEKKSDTDLPPELWLNRPNWRECILAPTAPQIYQYILGNYALVENSNK